MNTEHYQALQRAFDTAWPGPIDQPILLKKGHLHLQISPRDSARITSVQTFGLEVLRQWEPQRKTFQYGCFSMVPWAGHLGDATLTVGEKQHVLPANEPPHILHGTACYPSWGIVEHKTNTSKLCIPLDAPWPGQGEVLQMPTLGDDVLILRPEIYTMSEAFPASAGWRPWSAKQLGQQNEEDELLIHFKVGGQEEVGNNESPTGNKIPPQSGPWDDCFGSNNGLNVRLQWPGKLSMTVTSGAQSLVVPDKQPDAICVNPFTQAPDVVNRTPQFISADLPSVIESRRQFTQEFGWLSQ